MTGAATSSISQSFGAKAKSYDKYNRIQNHVSERLTEVILAQNPKLGDVLEVGCGTGVLSSQLIDHSSFYVLSDVSSEMVGVASRRCPQAIPLVVDLMHPCFAASFDVIVASLTLHWVVDINQALQRLTAMLKPGGSLFFSCFGSNTYHEWRTAHAMENAPCGLQDFPVLGQIKDSLPSIGGREVWEEWVCEENISSKRFLDGLKSIGANVPHVGHQPLQSSTMKRVMTRFDQISCVSYQVIYGAYVKPCYWSDE